MPIGETFAAKFLSRSEDNGMIRISHHRGKTKRLWGNNNGEKKLSLYVLSAHPYGACCWYKNKIEQQVKKCWMYKNKIEMQVKKCWIQNQCGNLKLIVSKWPTIKMSRGLTMKNVEITCRWVRPLLLVSEYPLGCNLLFVLSMLLVGGMLWADTRGRGPRTLELDEEISMISAFGIVK